MLSRKAQTEFLNRLICQRTIFQIFIADTAARLTQKIIIIFCRLLLKLQKLRLLVGLSSRLLGVLLLRQIDSASVSQCLYSLREGIIFIFHQKGKDISSRPAAKAIIHLFARRYGKRRGFFTVEGAESEIVGTLSLEPHIAGNHIHDVIS